MTDAKQRLSKLMEHKERTKHMRGRHDQRDHTRLDYLAGGLIGDRGGSGARGREVEMGNVDGGRGGSIGSDISYSTNNLSNRRRMYINENRTTPLSTDTTTGSGKYVGKRPERQAGIGMTQQAIERAASIRQQAIEMAKEYWRRHRMTNPSVRSQGLIAPIAMAMKPAGSFFEIGGQNVSLFEDPSRIMGNNPEDPSQKTNMLDHVQKQFDQRLDSYYNAMVNGGMSADDAQAYTDRISDVFNSQYESYMQKAAASFALDLQGFVGGEIYARNDPQYLAAQSMLTNVASDQNLNSLLLLGYIDDMQQNHPQAHKELAKTLNASNTEDMHKAMTTHSTEPMADWSMHNPSPKVNTPRYGKADLVKPETRPINIENSPESTGKLSRVNPALVSDIADRRERDTSKTMQLSRIWGLLHPKVQAQLTRMMQSDVVYPQTEDASQVFEKNPTESLNAPNNNGVSAFKSILSSLHTDGGIADVTVKEGDTQKASGTFTITSQASGQVGLEGKPAITLSTKPTGLTGDAETAHIMATMAHEFGHLIDYSALSFGEITGGNAIALSDVIGAHGGIPADTWQSKSPMAAPMLRIINRYLQGPMADSYEALDQVGGGTEGLAKAIKATSFLEYASQPREIFARLYEQWFAQETLRKIDAGEQIAGVNDHAAFRQGLADRLAAGTTTGLTQRFFNTADYEASVSDLMEIFNIMGWKLK